VTEAGASSQEPAARITRVAEGEPFILTLSIRPDLLKAGAVGRISAAVGAAVRAELDDEQAEHLLKKLEAERVRLGLAS